GFSISFVVHDTNGDGVVEVGEGILLDASQTQNPGRCVDGVPQYRFSKDPGAVLLQDWSTAASLKTSATANGDLYQVQVRCSSDTSCLTVLFGPPAGSVAGGCPVYTGPAPTPIEVTAPNSWSFTANSKNITGSMPNLLNSVTFNPTGQNFPPHAYAHSFLRTAGISGGSY